jgi:hypothetical protein
MVRMNLSARTVVGVAGLAAAAHALVLRPWMLAWGSTDDERSRRLPGDDIDPEAAYVTTRATTIKAPAEAVWPWLISGVRRRAEAAGPARSWVRG